MNLFTGLNPLQSIRLIIVIVRQKKQNYFKFCFFVLNCLKAYIQELY